MAVTTMINGLMNQMKNPTLAKNRKIATSH